MNMTALRIHSPSHSSVAQAMHAESSKEQVYLSRSRGWVRLGKHSAKVLSLYDSSGTKSGLAFRCHYQSSESPMMKVNVGREGEMLSKLSSHAREVVSHAMSTEWCLKVEIGRGCGS